MEKTLGQIWSDAFNEAFAEATLWTESEAAGIAAVARHVVAEAMAAHVAECHAPVDMAAKLASIPAVAEAARKDMEREKPQPGPNAWAARPWEVSEKPVGQPQPEAGDWAMDAWQHAVSEFNQSTHDGNVDNIDAAKAIRDAAELHYSRLGSVEHARRLVDRLDAARSEVEKLRKENDDQPRYYIDQKGKLWYGGRSVRSDNYHYREFFGWTDPTKTILQEIWIWARSDAGDGWRVVSDEEAREHIASYLPNWPSTPPTPPAATGDDELKAKIVGAFVAWRNDPNDERECDEVAYIAVRSSFDALRRERDEWKEKAEAERFAVRGQKPVVCTKCHYTPGTTKSKYCGDGSDKDNGHVYRPMDEVFQRAESAEAALGEIREAISWRSKQKIKISGHIHPDPPHEDSDAILAAYRATKAASGAAEVCAVAAREADHKERE